MPKSVFVTMTLTLEVEVPNSWTKGEQALDELQGKIEESLHWDVTSTNKKVVIAGDVDHQMETEVQED